MSNVYILSEYKKASTIKQFPITKLFHGLFETIKKKQDEIKADMKKKMLKPKEYIHCTGKWNAYLKYLESEIKKLC